MGKRKTQVIMHITYLEITMQLSVWDFELTFPSFDSCHLPSLQSLTDEVAPSSFTIVCLPMKEGDLLRLLPELDRVPLPPALMFWV